MAPSSLRRPGALSLLLLLCISSTLVSSQPLASSQAKTLLRVRRLLGYPSALAVLPAVPDPCALPPTPVLTVSCDGGQVTGLSVRGDREPDPAWRSALPSNFSADALFTTLTRLPALSRLSLVALGVWGPLPGPKLRRLQALQVLNLSSNYLYGAVPEQVSRMYSLQSLVLSGNYLNGTVPSLSGLAFLEELDVAKNRLGPAFPEVGKAVVRLVLPDNNFTGSIPAEVTSLGQLQFLDVSGNRLQGWIPSSIFALPALRYINLSRNQLAGQLPASTAFGEALEFVDVSANLLTGARPACMRSNSSARTVLDAGNCFADAKLQRPSTYCNPGALAAVLPPPQGNGDEQVRGKGGEVGMVLGFVGGVVGGALLLALVMVVVLRRARRQHPQVSVLPKSPVVTPAKKADGGKALAKVTQRITTPADKRHAVRMISTPVGPTAYRALSSRPDRGRPTLMVGGPLSHCAIYKDGRPAMTGPTSGPGGIGKSRPRPRLAGRGAARRPRARGAAEWAARERARVERPAERAGRVRPCGQAAVGRGPGRTGRNGRMHRLNPMAYISHIPALDGNNYRVWREKYDLALALSENDLALTSPCPTEPVDPVRVENETDADFTARKRDHAEVRMKYDLEKKKWDISNRKCLMVAKATIADPIRGSIPDCDTATEYLQKVKNQFTGSSKATASTLIKKLVNERYSSGGIREHILKMSTTAAKLNSMDMGLKDEFLIHLIFASLPKEFDTFVVNYNMQPDKWDIEKLIAMCVQEEERLKTSQGDFANLVKNNKRKNFNAKPQGKPQWDSSSSSKSQGKVPQFHKPNQFTVDKDTCKFCKKKAGHYQRDCPEFLKHLLKNGIPYEEDPTKRRKNN